LIAADHRAILLPLVFCGGEMSRNDSDIGCLLVLKTEGSSK
jgi:hypothetical protein